MRWGACLGKQLEVVCHPWVQHGRGQPFRPSSQSLPGGFIGALYHISASGVISYIPYLQEGVPPASTLRWSPKHILLSRVESWRRDKRDLEVLLIPRAKNLLLWRIFLSSNQWKCVYQETVFDLDKCFTDVNKAGERDRGRRDKEGWERRGSHRKDQEGGEEMKGAEIRRDPAFPCPSCRRAEIGARTHPELCPDPC